MHVTQLLSWTQISIQLNVSFMCDSCLNVEEYELPEA